MNTLGYVPSWAREVAEPHRTKGASHEELASLLFKERPRGVAPDYDSCIAWAGFILEEFANGVPAPTEAPDARIRREYTEAYQEKLRKHPWPECGQDSGV